MYYVKQEWRLKGNDSIERGQYFNRVLLNDNLYRKEIYQNYNELFRILDVKVKNGVDFVVKIIGDTESDLLRVGREHEMPNILMLE